MDDMQGHTEELFARVDLANLRGQAVLGEATAPARAHQLVEDHGADADRKTATLGIPKLPDSVERFETPSCMPNLGHVFSE